MTLFWIDDDGLDVAMVLSLGIFTVDKIIQIISEIQQSSIKKTKNLYNTLYYACDDYLLDCKF